MEKLDLSGMNLPEKEEKILQAAIQVFAEKGFNAATTSEIAKGAGIAEGTIFRYFKTKKDILRGILIQAINLFSGKFVMAGIVNILDDSEGKDLRTVLKEILYDRLKLVDKFFPIARVIFTEALVHEDVREAIYQNIIVQAVDTFTLFHAKMAEKGMIRKDVEPVMLLRSILGSLGIFIAQRKILGDRIPVEDFEKDVDKMLDVLLYGIAPQAQD